MEEDPAPLSVVPSSGSRSLVTSSSSSSSNSTNTATTSAPPFSSSNSNATHQTVFLLSSPEQRAVTTRSSLNPVLITQRHGGLVEIIDQVPRLDFHRSMRGPAILILLFVTVFVGLTLGKAALESGAFQSFANFYLGSTGGGGI